MTTNGLSAQDLLEFSFLSDPQLSPDGKWVVFVKRVINEKEKYQSNLFLLHVDSKETTQFTQGNFSDVQPRWSPDGRYIFFVSNRSGKQQIWKIAFSGGEASQVTTFKRGASQSVLSPDGTKLIVTVPLTASDSLEDKETKEKTEEKLKPYITTNLQYKSDAKGFSDETFDHLALIDLETGTQTLLTDGQYNHHSPAFSPAGMHVAYSANRSEDPEQTFFSDIYQLDLATNDTEKLTSSDKRFYTPNYSPDGTKLSLLGDDLEYTGATLTRVWSLDLATKELSCLTSEWDVECHDVAINDMGTGAASSGAVWSKTNDAVFFLASELGSTHLYQVTLDKNITKVIGGKRQVYAYSTDKNQDRFVYAVSQSAAIPGDLFVSTLSGSDEQRLTAVNENLLQTKTVSTPEDFRFKANDGTELQGWIMKPTGFKDGETYPLVLEIHGGPHAMYSHAFMHEFQVLASKGYGVLYMNPRGSHGYGQQFVDAVRGDYGGIDYDDVMVAVDYALENYDWIDASRLGVTGGSYGGFMTNWIVGHTNKFKAAVTQRSISNWLSFYGVSDIGYFFTEWEHKTTVMEDPEELWRISPLCYVKDVQTPLLILHSENDYRCPIEQAEQLYIALKQQKKPTRFVRFPESNHELSRSGDPGLRIIRLNEITDWFDQYLK
ncbi:S9 family peptidase [Terribacillus saccharophilus]|uniref:Peptidase n=1 Tax=Terribacillus saccharophilus TaxID=361277 RepID=A0ABX4GW61_9BACI|nr:S9 family peptidase [Terribacillus saccharophilus]PAD34788.1 peptidase [Terribacillus saccharophilus]PAD95534.1 peptidase [Terribacillus saccharophilus]PAD99113.1 peptidase [Terribacillus saccharophilus]